MKCLSVSQMKNSKSAKNSQPLPREGGQLRNIYDEFQKNKGVVIDFNPPRNDPNALRKLIDFYGLDIRRIQNGSKRTGRASRYVLAGEWFGRIYVDYIAERLERAA